MESGQLRIDLNPKVKPIIKAVLSLRGFLMLVIALGALHTGINFIHESTLVAVICFIVFIFFIVLGKKFLEQVFFHEYLVINHECIKVFHKTFLQEKELTFNLEGIKHFGYAGPQKYTQHAMHNDVIDFTGLQASEKELQYVIDNGTLEIESEAQKHRFGKNMASWDAEEIILKVETFYGRGFQREIIID